MAERANRVEFTLSDEVWARLEAARGFEPRASFVKRALESALESTTSGATGSDPARLTPVSSRAPVEKEPGGQRSGDTTSVSNPRRSGSVKETAPTESPAPSRPARQKPSLRDTWGR